MAASFGGPTLDPIWPPRAKRRVRLGRGAWTRPSGGDGWTGEWKRSGVGVVVGHDGMLRVTEEREEEFSTFSSLSFSVLSYRTVRSVARIMETNLFYTPSLVFTCETCILVNYVGGEDTLRRWSFGTRSRDDRGYTRSLAGRHTDLIGWSRILMQTRISRITRVFYGNISVVRDGISVKYKSIWKVVRYLEIREQFKKRIFLFLQFLVFSKLIMISLIYDKKC